MRVGTVSKSKASEGKMLVCVDIQGAESDWLPVRGLCNAFIKLFVPVLVGEQVMVFSEYGDLHKAYVVPSLFSNDAPEPSGGDASTVVLEVGENRFEIDKSTMKCTLTSLSIVADVSIEGNVDISEALYVNGDISTDGGVEDSRGDLTNFTTTDGASRA